MLKIVLILTALTSSFAEIDPEILASKIAQVLYERRYSQLKERNDLKVMVPLSFIEDRLFCDKTKPHIDIHHKPGLASVLNEHKHPQKPIEHEHQPIKHNPHGVIDHELLQGILHKPYHVLSGIKDKFKPLEHHESLPFLHIPANHGYHGIKDHEGLSFLHKPSNHGHHGIKDHEKPDILGIKDHESLPFLHKPVNHGHHGIKDHETSSHIDKPDILGIKDSTPYHDHEQIIHGIKEHVHSILHKPINVISGIKETLNEHNNHGLDHEGLNLKPVRESSLKEIKTDNSDDHESARENETTIRYGQEQQSSPNEEVTTVEIATEKNSTRRPLRRRKPTKNQNEEGPFWMNIFTTQRPINKKRESTRKSSADKKIKTPETDETRVNKKEN